jgi:8-oxo-dGTP diphosphatase
VKRAAATVLLLRHARAADKHAWPGPDEERPLDGLGARQAQALAASLGALRPARILSSPLRRCHESVAPLAETLLLPVELRAELSVQATLADALGLLGGLGDGLAVACTHREVIERLLGPGHRCAKAGAWLVEVHGSALVRVRYLPAPTRARVRELDRLAPA